MPKKQPIKLSPGRSGRRVRLTFDVSADVDAEKRSRVKKPAKGPAGKRTKAKSTARPARRSTVSPVQKANDPGSSVAATGAVPSTRSVAGTSAPIEATSAIAAAPQLAAAARKTRAQVAALSAVAVLVIALVAIPRQPSPPGSANAPEPAPVEQREVAEEPPPRSPKAEVPPPPATRNPAPPTVKPRALTEPARKSPAQSGTNRTADDPTPTPPSSLAANAPASSVAAPTTKTRLAEPTPAARVPASAATVSAVTITGCLEISTDGDEFRLADTEGADAPKSRSWRTGFLRRRTAPVNLVGITDPVALKRSVGSRVAATGLLTDRELQVSSFRAVGASCN